jgi:hypothetical protein
MRLTDETSTPIPNGCCNGTALSRMSGFLWSAAITPPARMERRWFRNLRAPHYLTKKSQVQVGSEK